jgi:curli biogenesis system outer membrane secretion channel CsgG
LWECLTERTQSDITRQTKGVVRSYRILEVDQDGPDHYIAHLSVTIEKFRAKGLGNGSRRRIAVTAFNEPNGDGRLSAMLRDRITAALAQSRRFAVVDRANDRAYEEEMAALADAPVTECVRLGQVIGADYVVVGAIRRAGVSRHAETIELTGERIESAASAIEADFQVLEIATRQIKWASTVRLAEGGDEFSKMVERVALRIGSSSSTIPPSSSSIRAEARYSRVNAFAPWLWVRRSSIPTRRSR